MSAWFAKRGAEIVAGLVALALIVGFVAYTLTSSSHARKDAAVSKATAVTADASKAAAQDAVKIIVESQAAHGRIDIVTQGNADAIRHAPGASAVVDPALHDTGLRALCLHDAYRLQPACVGLLQPSASEPSARDAGSPASR